MTLKEIAQKKPMFLFQPFLGNQPKSQMLPALRWLSEFGKLRRNGYVPNRTAQDLKKGVQAENKCR